MATVTLSEDRLRSYGRHYLAHSRRPLVSLSFVLPLLLLYEAGVLVMPRSLRNGADLWLRRLLETLGLEGYFLLPALTIATLLAWHHTTRQPWKVSGVALWLMVCESALFGLLLVAVAKITGQLLLCVGPATLLPLGTTWEHVFGQVVRFSGAGIYEEVLFRLLLLPLTLWFLRAAGVHRGVQIVVGVLATSLLFSLAHYVGQFGDPLSWYTFTFRFAAGVFFATLFVYRGFGIAAGSHALYDVFVGVRWL